MEIDTKDAKAWVDSMFTDGSPGWHRQRAQRSADYYKKFKRMHDRRNSARQARREKMDLSAAKDWVDVHLKDRNIIEALLVHWHNLRKVRPASVYFVDPVLTFVGP
jgi:hypothetical protein